jgi:hypothetical protein
MSQMFVLYIREFLVMRRSFGLWMYSMLMLKSQNLPDTLFPNEQ